MNPNLDLPETENQKGIFFHHKGTKDLKPGPMAPYILFQRFFILLQAEIHGGILDGQSTGMSQSIHQDNDILRILSYGVTIKFHNANDLFPGLYWNTKDRSDTLF